MSGLFVQVFNASRQGLGVVPAEQIASGGNIIPDADNAYDIGSALLRWRKGYFSSDVSVAGVLGSSYVTVDGGVALFAGINPGAHLALDCTPTAVRTATFPDASGNVVVDSVATTFTAAQQFNNGIVLRSAAIGSRMSVFAYNNEPADGEFRTVFVAGALPAFAGSHYLVSIDASAAAIPDPAGGGTVDVECRAAVASILAMLRTTYPAMVTP